MARFEREIEKRMEVACKKGKWCEGGGGHDGGNDGGNVPEGAKDVFLAIKRNPGAKTPILRKAVGRSQASIERALSVIKRLHKIEFRGAPKTGGYYCKE